MIVVRNSKDEIVPYSKLDEEVCKLWNITPSNYYAVPNIIKEKDEQTIKELNWFNQLIGILDQYKLSNNINWDDSAYFCCSNWFYTFLITSEDEDVFVPKVKTYKELEDNYQKVYNIVESYLSVIRLFIYEGYYLEKEDSNE